MRLKGKRIAFLLEEGFEDLEFWVTVMRLREEGAVVNVVGTAPEKTVRGRMAYPPPVKWARTLSAPMISTRWSCPAAGPPTSCAATRLLPAWCATAYEQGKIVGLICHAGLVGISAGIVQGHRATGSLGIKDDLVNAGATWVDQPAFRDGNIVWGRVVDDIPPFCRELVKAIAGD